MPQQDVRASGLTPADEAAREETKRLDEPQGLEDAATSRPEDKGTTLTPAFARMRTDWQGPDHEVITKMKRAVNLLIQQQFADVFDIFYQLYALVREFDVDESTGQVRTDELGVAQWKRNPATGSYIENWDRIGIKEREHFLYRLTSGLFRWEQIAADIWGEAMFGRASFDEAFSHGFEELPGDRPTIDDRTARARIRAAEYRYRAVYLSYLSRKADAAVRSAERLSQRLKDLHTS